MKLAPRVIIIGGGLAGLACAVRLQEAEIPFLLLEASKSLGGRVQTDHFEEYLLNRGFQVLLTSYPEAQRLLDFTQLKLHPFHAGALVRWQGKFYKISDLFRHPLDVFTSLVTPIGTFSDKMNLARLKEKMLHTSPQDLALHPETTTLEFLTNEGFSKSIIERFFRPLFSSVFLERGLQTSSRMFEFVFRMLSSGVAALPEDGMGAISSQLAKRLPPASVRTNARVTSIQDGIINLGQAETLGAEAIVVATDGTEAARLLPDLAVPAFRSVMCLYYEALKPPWEDPLLLINGDNRGPINNMSVLSNICLKYAPEGHSLISVSVLGYNEEEELEFEAEVRKQLVEWFPEDAIKWRYLRSYKIKYAQPVQTPPALASMERPVKMRQGVFVCGDHRDTASIQGALVSGRRAAEAVLADLPA
jgi:phytoene dehydrogenase-like protein